ncbi:MAG: hypothetical protein IT174_08890 [Acidobacteria bacterium]|nr:hypothetical protein [Acidobacteriota bacterium]
MELFRKCLLGVLVGLISFAVPAQNVPANRANEDYRIASANERPDLSVEIGSVAKLKVAVRKESYVIGEMLIIDAALLTISRQKVFLPSINSVEVLAEGKIVPYIVKGKTAGLARSDPETLDTISLLYLVGCTEDPFESRNSPFQRTAITRFERNLFISWGEGCLNVQKLDEVDIYAEIVNESVLVSPKGSGLKTATGSLRSPKVRIRVK